MQYGMLTRKAKSSPLAKMFGNIETKLIYIKKEGTRWIECDSAQSSLRFSLARSVLCSTNFAMYSLIIDTHGQRVHVTRVGTFTQLSSAKLALNRGKLSCNIYRQQRRKTEPNTHVQCPSHPQETCNINLGKNIQAPRELRNGIEREYFIVNAGKIEFANITWWR